MRYVLALLITLLAIHLDGWISHARTLILSEHDLLLISLGSLPNLIGCFFLPIVLKLTFRSKSAVSMGIGYTLGTVIYEILQYFLPKGSFDPFDIAFSLFGLLLFLFLMLLINACQRIWINRQS